MTANASRVVNNLGPLYWAVLFLSMHLAFLIVGGLQYNTRAAELDALHCRLLTTSYRPVIMRAWSSRLAVH